MRSFPYISIPVILYTPVSASTHLLTIGSLAPNVKIASPRSQPLFLGSLLVLEFVLKILLITLKARLGLAPNYIIELLIQYELEHSQRSLGSSDCSRLTGPRSWLCSEGDQALIKPLNDGTTCLRYCSTVFSLRSLFKTTGLPIIFFAFGLFDAWMCGVSL